MEQMRIKHNETGRSMVEMLGVLAIMGVLSIGGVAGYRYAVDKMNANEIINELKKRAITASQQRVLGQGINLSEYGAILGKYAVDTIDDFYEDEAGYFVLETKNIPQEVCNFILKSDWGLPTEMIIGESSVSANDTCPDETNNITFVFHHTLKSGKSIGDNNENEGGTNTNPDDNNDTPLNPPESCPAGTSSNGEGGIAKTLSDGTVCQCLNANEIYDSEQGCTTPANPCEAICGDGWNCELIDGKCVANAHATANGMWECFNNTKVIQCSATYMCIDNPDIVEEIDCSSGSSQSYTKYADIGSYTLCTSLPVTCPNSGGGIPSGPIIPSPVMPNN